VTKHCMSWTMSLPFRGHRSLGSAEPGPVWLGRE
jgi:hypothetical protein